MKKTIIFILITIIFIGCRFPDESTDYYTTGSSVPTGTTHYLSLSEYDQLLTILGYKSYIDKSTIDSALSDMGVSLSYESSKFISDDYVCYGMNWNEWSSYGWIYYVDVDIWVVNGQLNTGMCSYYRD